MRVPLPAFLPLGLLLLAGPAQADPSINFFGDTGYELQHDDAWSNSFRAATLDIFATQTEGKFTFVGEAVIEAFGSNDFSIDADRLEVTYQPRKWLRLRIGRMRTAFGYYGDAYQNGRFFMTTVAAPLMYEGNGIDGVVPAHSVGAHVDVVADLGGDAGKVTLDAEVLNGRAASLDEVSAFQDANNSKAVNLRLRYRGAGALDGLVVGGNLYLDDLAASAATGQSALREIIGAGHVAYLTDQLHVVAETVYIHHREAGSGRTFSTSASFAELGFAFGDLTPYARYQHTIYTGSDPYFVSSGIPTMNIHQVSVGAKYAASASVAVKLELAANLFDDLRMATFQAAFAF